MSDGEMLIDDLVERTHNLIELCPDQGMRTPFKVRCISADGTELVTRYEEGGDLHLIKTPPPDAVLATPVQVVVEDRNGRERAVTFVTGTDDRPTMH